MYNEYADSCTDSPASYSEPNDRSQNRKIVVPSTSSRIACSFSLDRLRSTVCWIKLIALWFWLILRSSFFIRYQHRKWTESKKWIKWNSCAHVHLLGKQYLQLDSNKYSLLMEKKQPWTISYTNKLAGP